VVPLKLREYTPLSNAMEDTAQTRPNRSGKLFFNPLAIFSMFTSETFLTPRSMPL